MPSSAIRSRIRLWIVPAALVLVLAAPMIEEAQAQSDEAVTQAGCQTAWNSASARLTCSTGGDITLSTGQCRIRKECNHWICSTRGCGNMKVANDVTVPLDDVDDLNNCDGNLQVGAC